MFSGHNEDGPHREGVGLLISKTAKRTLRGWENLGPRIIRASFSTRNKNINTLEPDHATVAYALQRRSSRITQPLRTEIQKILTNVIFNPQHRMTTQTEAQTLIYLYSKLQPCTHSELFLVIFTRHVIVFKKQHSYCKWLLGDWEYWWWNRCYLIISPSFFQLSIWSSRVYKFCGWVMLDLKDLC